MTRYYGPDHRDSLNAQFQTIRNTDYVDPANYSTNISNVYVDTRFVSLRTDATNAALSANTHVCNIQGISLSAINTITNFYDNSEAIAAAIYRDAQGYCEVLRNLTETVNRLSELLRSVKSDGSLITVNDLRIACEPIRTANKIAIATALAGLYNPDGTMNEENAQQFRDAMAEMGITDITDEELALLYKIFVYLTQELGMDPAEVIGDMPYIYNSAEFNQMINNPYVAGNSEAFWQNMAGIADRIRNAGDLSAYNYLLVVDNLIDENGEFNETLLESYRDMLTELGVNDVTEEDIRNYLLVVERLRELGYTDEQILELTPYIYQTESLSQVGYIDHIPSANRFDVLDGVIASAEQLKADEAVQDTRNKMVWFMETVAASPNWGYELNAWGNVNEDGSPNLDSPTEVDCSHLVLLACQYAGIDISNIYSTSSMLSLTDRGFTAYACGSQIDIPNDLQPGDILLNTSHHAAMYVGNGQIVEAWHNELSNGNGGWCYSGGAAGDQNNNSGNTSEEIIRQDYRDYSANKGGWQYVLRYTGSVGDEN